MTEAYIDGVALTSLDGRIRIVRVSEDAPALTVKNYAKPNGGVFAPEYTLEQRKVKIGVGVFAPRMEERMAVMHRVLEWAGGRELCLSYRPGKRLLVRMNGAPAYTSDDWSQQCDISFGTLAVPYWESSEESKSTLNGRNANGALMLTGTQDGAVVDCTVSNTSGTVCTSLVLECGETILEFAGTNLIPSGRSLIISHDEYGIFSAKVLNGSRLGNRSAESSDFLLAKAGGNTVKLTADVNVTATFAARGLWL